MDRISREKVDEVMGYIMELRKIVGSRPLIMTGACVIVVNSAHEVLLQLRKDNQCWGLAGGSLEPGETLEQTAMRELREETGLHATRLELFNVFSGKAFYYQYPHRDEVYNVITTYVCTAYEGTLERGEHEVKELKFFKLTDLPSNINPPDIPIIREFEEKYVMRRDPMDNQDEEPPYQRESLRQLEQKKAQARK